MIRRKLFFSLYKNHNRNWHRKVLRVRETLSFAWINCGSISHSREIGKFSFSNKIRDDWAHSIRFHPIYWVSHEPYWLFPALLTTKSSREFKSIFSSKVSFSFTCHVHADDVKEMFSSFHNQLKAGAEEVGGKWVYDGFVFWAWVKLVKISVYVHIWRTKRAGRKFRVISFFSVDYSMCNEIIARSWVIKTKYTRQMRRFDGNKIELA